MTLFLAGDVMTGRGIDQVLPHPSKPRLYESYLKTAEGYMELAEQAHGAIPRPVEFSYVWGDALAEWERVKPDARIVNLETSVTTSGDWVPKGINYRMHPKNVFCLTAAGIDAAALANNHLMDWGPAGLLETLETLHGEGVKTAGAGRDLREAHAPAVLELIDKGRVLLFAFGSTTSGIPPDWAASEDGPGVNLLEDLSPTAAQRIARQVRAVKQTGDVIVASIHWGPNWGYEIPWKEREFAHRLIDDAGVDVVHGHSSHHPKGIEVYQDRPILYGCGDFLNDYEGIRGREEFRSHLVLMYFPEMDGSTGKLLRFSLTPMQIRRFRLNRPSPEDARWLRDRLDRECEKLGASVLLETEDTLRLEWR